MFENKKEQMTKQPFKVFQAEEEWKQAVMEEMEKMQGERGTQSQQRNDVSQIKQRLLAEEAKIKEKYPEFDLRQMLIEDPEFRERVLKGYSIEEAFYLSNRKKSEEPAPKKKIGMRENGRGNFMGTGANRDIKSMSDSDFKKYIDSIKGSKF